MQMVQNAPCMLRVQGLHKSGRIPLASRFSGHLPLSLMQSQTAATWPSHTHLDVEVISPWQATMPSVYSPKVQLLTAARLSQDHRVLDLAKPRYYLVQPQHVWDIHSLKKHCLHGAKGKLVPWRILLQYLKWFPNGSRVSPMALYKSSTFSIIYTQPSIHSINFLPLTPSTYPLFYSEWTLGS
jgi:hypothetical protein